jgi:methyl-CpG-binding domain protein 4
VTLLNKTMGRVAIPVFWDIIKKWPTPWAMSQGESVLKDIEILQ